MTRGGENNFKHKSFNILNEKKKYSGTKKGKTVKSTVDDKNSTKDNRFSHSFGSWVARSASMNC